MCASPAFGAPVADKGVLADTLNSTNTVAPGTPAPYPEANSQTKAYRAEARNQRRRERDRIRERIREERYLASLRKAESRDSARRMDNMYVGAVLSVHTLNFDPGNDTTDTETAPSVGILVGYRNHVSRKLGFKTGMYYHTGVTLVEREYDRGSWIYTERTHGSQGTTSGFEAVGQVILGPLGRFAIEPGIAYGLGWHSAKAISLSGQTDDTYVPKPRFSTLAGVIGATLFLGSRDQINPTGWIALGKVLGEDDALTFQVNVGLVVAFRED